MANKEYGFVRLFSVAFVRFRKLYFSLGLLFLLILLGVTGFILIEGYTLIEAFYMTIITVSTVGFSEVRPLTDSGRLFTTFLIITSISVYAYAVSVITVYIVNGEFSRYYKYFKVNNKISKLKDHVIVCGYGRNGKQACENLKSHDIVYVIIENNPLVTTNFQQDSNSLFVIGNSTHDEVLIEAGITHARALITTLPSDADNVFVVLTAREMNPSLTIISRASEDGSLAKLKRAGANNVIMPDKIGGSHMASLVSKPDVLEFIDYITGQGGTDIRLEEILCDRLQSELKSKTIRELEIREKSGANIIGFKTADGEYIINPSPDTLMIPDAKLFVLGTKDQISKLQGLLT